MRFFLILIFICISSLNSFSQINSLNKYGRKQGIWITYYDANTVKEKTQYDHGKKTGIWLEFYITGKLRADCFYQNDSLVGYKNTYYADGNLLEVTDEKTFTKTFYKNGNMKEESDFQTYSKRYYENGSIKEVYGLPKNRFSDFTKILEINEQGDTIFPGKIRTIKPQIITRKDTAFGIKNASNKTVSILFNQSDFSKRNNPDFIWFDFDIFLGANISMQDTLLNLYFPFTKLLISISPNNTYLSYDLGANLGDSIHVSTFQRYNMSPKKGNVSSYGIGNNKIRADFRSFYAIINGSTGGCPDSGENPTNLYFKGRKVSFSEIDNLQIIECDLNKDGRNEIYIMSSVACQSCIRLFKIE